MLLRRIYHGEISVLDELTKETDIDKYYQIPKDYVRFHNPAQNSGKAMSQCLSTLETDQLKLTVESV